MSDPHLFAGPQHIWAEHSREAGPEVVGITHASTRWTAASIQQLHVLLLCQEGVPLGQQGASHHVILCKQYNFMMSSPLVSHLLIFYSPLKNRDAEAAGLVVPVQCLQEDFENVNHGQQRHMILP